VALLAVACTTKETLTPGERYLEVNGGKIWYKVVGESDKTPLLLLHGGPSYPSYYLNPLLKLSRDRPVIIFDQLGCGRSDRITDTTLMTIENHIDQINRLLAELNVKEFYLYGHSWGTMLGTEYYLKNSTRVKGMILGSPCLSTKMWVNDADTLIAALPDSIHVILRNNIKGVPQDSTTLANAVGVYFSNYYIRKSPPSADIDSTFLQVGLNVYGYMWGTNEFFSTGTLKNFDMTQDLGRITVPTLYITGEFDAATPGTVKYYQSLTPNSRLSITSNAGHITMHDNPVGDIEAISNLLSELDKLE
jgi:proline iminopeptidase